MSGSATRKVKSAVAIMMVTVPVSILYDYLDLEPNTEMTYVSIIIGVFLAAPLVLFDGSAFDEWMRRQPFSVALFARVFSYTASLFVVFTSVGLVVGLIQGLTWSDWFDSMTDLDQWKAISTGMVMYMVIVFFRQLNRLLGPGVLGRYLMGKYHQPRRETRIFMFLDLKSSTTLADELGHERYYGLVNEFFRDISAPVLDNGGEIYEYIGDEAVITWKEARGIREASCLKFFFDLDAVIAHKRQHYLDRFGVVPEYKAGVHLGEVITAEIGDLKRGLVFNGDVLNTGARIQGECGRLDRRLVVSAPIVERLKLPQGYTPEPMGPVSLRGKAEPIELIAFA
jgi:adenylate cyclase